MTADYLHVAAIALGVFLGCIAMTLAGWIGRRRVGR